MNKYDSLGLVSDIFCDGSITDEPVDLLKIITNQQEDIDELKRVVLKLLQKDHPEEVLTVVEKWKIDE